MGGIGSHQHGVMSTYYLKTAKNPISKPTQYPKVQKSQLWHTRRTPSTHFFYENLYTSYWDIDEWIWVLTFVVWTIWKNDIFSTGPPSGVEGLSRPVLLAAVLIEPKTLVGVVGRERSVNSLAPLAKLVGMALLGGPLLGPSPMLTLPLSGYVATCHFGGCSNLGLIGSGFLVCSFHASERCDKMILEWVPSFCVRDIPELCNCNNQKDVT